MNTITTEMVQRAMKGNVFLASACNAKEKKSKDLYFDLSQLKYRVRYCHVNDLTSSSFKSRKLAIDKYNSYKM